MHVCLQQGYLNDEDDVSSPSYETTLDENQEEVISYIPCSRCAIRIPRNLTPSLYSYEPAYFPTQYRLGHPVYKPLDQLCDEIRLLLILPDTENNTSPLVCKLAHVPLRSKPAYFALSYTWGDRTDLRSIQLNGQPFDVTANLHAALLHMRGASSILAFWVDAICINQEDVVERNRQVRRMADIYKEAISIQVWLGSSENNSDLAMAKMTQIFQDCLRDSKTGCGARDHVTSDPQENPAWEGIYRLLSRPWFKRTWVVQEVALAASSLICFGWVACGSQRTSWAAICHASKLIASRWNMIILRIPGQERDRMVFDVDDPETHFSKCITLERLRELRCSGNPMHLLPVMIAYQNTKATDPRDKIYGFFGIADDAVDLVSKPDYAHSVEQVYISFVEAYVQKYRRLDVICAAQSNAPGNTFRLPNWVPNWNQNSSHNPFLYNIQSIPFIPLGTTEKHSKEQHHYKDEPLYCAAGTTRSIVRFGRNPSTGIISELIAVGLSCDIIERVGDSKFVIPARPRPEWKAMMIEFHETLGDKQPYTDQIQAFWHTMMAGRTPAPGVAVPEDLTFLENVWHETEPDVDFQQGYRWRLHMSEILKRRNFIITKRGYVGLAHGFCQKGDLVCILFGCSVPVILRKVSNLYFFLGDCYIQGWMNGEMLLEKEAGGDQQVLDDKVKEKSMEKSMDYLDSWLDDHTRKPSPSPSDEQIEDVTEPRVFRIR